MQIEGNPDLWLYLKREKENRDFINKLRNKNKEPQIEEERKIRNKILRRIANWLYSVS